MAIETVIRTILEQVLYWSHFLFVIALIYAIVKLISVGLGQARADGSAGGLFRGLGDWLNRKRERAPSEPAAPREPREPGATPPKGPDPRDLDWENPGWVRFVVQSYDGRGLVGATVKVSPEKANKWMPRFLARRVRKGYPRRDPSGVTDSRGTWPSHDHLELASGRWIYQVSHPEAGRFLNKAKNLLIVNPGRDAAQVITVTMKVHDEKIAGFEPHIILVEGAEQGGRRILRLNGRVE